MMNTDSKSRTMKRRLSAEPLVTLSGHDICRAKGYTASCREQKGDDIMNTVSLLGLERR